MCSSRQRILRSNQLKLERLNQSGIKTKACLKKVFVNENLKAEKVDKTKAEQATQAQALRRDIQPKFCCRASF